MIKFDLHIHSLASLYKESPNVVDKSTVENTGVLLKKLKENDIKMFSITDHNRFDIEIYKAFDREIKYGNFDISLLSGVEFDVIIDEPMNPCHIIVIFNAKNDVINYEKINLAIGKNLLTSREKYYEIDEFEKILADAGLDVLLIANQPTSLTNIDKKKKSLSCSSSNPKELLKIGYISALEFQRVKVEGILISNLIEIDENFALISGSDCHTWECYPQHDILQQPRECCYTEANILPTFKGLLMAFTSRKTRFSRLGNSNPSYISSININTQDIPLVNGINAIIGENGSGKSSMLEIFYNEDLPQYIKDIKKNNSINNNVIFDNKKIKYIPQGSIVYNFRQGKLFDNKDLFVELDHENLRTEYLNYIEDIKTTINWNIDKKNLDSEINDKELLIKYYPKESSFYILISAISSAFTNIEDIHETPLKQIGGLLKNLVNLSKLDYFKEYKDTLDSMQLELEQIKDKISQKSLDIKLKSKLNNTIKKEINKYNSEIESKLTLQTKEEKEYQINCQNFIDYLVKYYNKILRVPKSIENPKIISNSSVFEKNGFMFYQSSLYHDKDMCSEFLKTVFNKNYQTKSKLLEIDTTDKFVEAITGCSNSENIDEQLKKNVEKFLNNYTKKSIQEIKEIGESEEIGSTLGELSLAYLKYITSERDDWNILMIDQPEDNISNIKINSELIKYLHSIRDQKQIILVTHNPLLVVNLDVDNVISLKQKNKKICVESGPLEYEDNVINILQTVADTMDGGQETISRRLKVYGKNNNN